MSIPSFLEFFVLEAADYVEQLDGLLHAGREQGPDAGALQRIARALRGSATMAKLPSFAEVAGGLERVGRRVQEHALPWDGALAAVTVGAVDDLRVLLRNARSWSAADEERAAARCAELARYAPATARTPGGSEAATSGLSYFAGEAANIAAGLEVLLTRPDDRDTAAQVLRRARALRGVAGINDVPDLADALDAIEDAAHDIERAGTPLGEVGGRVVQAAATLLRSVAASLGAGRAAPGDAERAGLSAAIDEWTAHEAARERVHPIADLYFDDAGPHVISQSDRPPTTASVRFRIELVSRGEHLRGLVEDARARPDQSPARIRRQLMRVLASLGNVAASFGERELAAAVDSMAAHVSGSAAVDLDAVDRVATALCDPGTRGERVTAALTRASRPTPAAPVDVTPPPTRASMPTPVIPISAVNVPAAPATPATPTAPPRRNTPPVGALTPPADVIASLDEGIAAFGAIATQPLSPSAPIPVPEIVPIHTLLYRGEGAVARARELREELRRTGQPPTAEALDELVDLVALAAAG